MSRILKAYETTFRSALEHFGARRLDQGVHLLLEKAKCLSEFESVPLPAALARVYAELSAKRATHIFPNSPKGEPSLFLCDAGLGGLARWLRATGYEARWRADIDDDEL